MPVPFLDTLLFKSNNSGVTTAINLGNRFAYAINVLEYGADPTGVADSYSAVQTAFDKAFGPASSPHGSANASQNKPVFFPNGTYSFFGGTPTLTRVVGGYIFGEGPGATTLSGAGGSTATLATNGCANVTFDRLTVINSGAGSIAIDLDWDNTSGGDGLHNNLFRNVFTQNAATAIRVGFSGHGGANNIFEACGIASGGIGIDLYGTGAVNNMALLGGAGGSTGYYCRGGSIHLFEPSLSVAGNTADIQIDSGLPVAIIGGRTESDNFIVLNSGIVTVRGTGCSTSVIKAIQMLGGKASFDGVNFGPSVISGSIATAPNGSISGSVFTQGASVTGSIQVGQYLKGSGIPTGSTAPYIVSSGGGGTWNLNYAPGNVTTSITCGSLLYLRCTSNTAGAGFLSGYNGLGGNADHTVENI